MYFISPAMSMQINPLSLTFLYVNCSCCYYSVDLVLLKIVIKNLLSTKLRLTLDLIFFFNTFFSEIIVHLMIQIRHPSILKENQ